MEKSRTKNRVLLAVAITLLISIAAAFSASVYIYANTYHTVSTKSDAIVTEENGITTATIRVFLIDTYPISGVVSTTKIDLVTLNDTASDVPIRWALTNEHNITIEAGNYNMTHTIIYDPKQNTITFSPNATFFGNSVLGHFFLLIYTL